MNIEKQLRKLARSNYYQEIYHASKECAGIHLFENNYNLSGIQYLFFYWLRVYSMLYDELNRLEWENLDIKVIKDDDRCDAFLYWRSRQIQKDIRRIKKEERKSKRSSGKKMKIFSGVKKEGDG